MNPGNAIWGWNNNYTESLLDSDFQLCGNLPTADNMTNFVSIGDGDVFTLQSNLTYGTMIASSTVTFSLSEQYIAVNSELFFSIIEELIGLGVPVSAVPFTGGAAGPVDLMVTNGYECQEF